MRFSYYKYAHMGYSQTCLYLKGLAYVGVLMVYRMLTWSN